MSSIKLKNNIYWVGVKNPELRVFDIIMQTKKGTTYNSYLINDDKVAVIDTVKNGYFDEFLKNIKEVIGEKKVDYIIVQHTELDHSGSLSRLMSEYPDAIVVGSKAALMYTKDIVNKEFKAMEMPSELSLGGISLRFVSAPNLHWPDTIFTYAVQDRVLFTCDFLGSHYCPDGSITDNYPNDYYDEMKLYYDAIMGPFKKFVLLGIDKIKDVKADIVAPSHGPIHTGDIEKCIKLYADWSKPNIKKEKNVQIFYVSAYGNTQKIAEYISKKINENGIMAETHEITSLNPVKISGLVENSSGILIGSPTINQDALKPAWDMLSMVCPITNRGKAAGAFGSYGWSGEGVLMLTQRLKGLKFKTVEPGFRFKFVPSDEDFKKADEFIQQFISLL